MEDLEAFLPGDKAAAALATLDVDRDGTVSLADMRDAVLQVGEPALSDPGPEGLSIGTLANALDLRCQDRGGGVQCRCGSRA